MMTAVALRRLRTSDLDRIEELERESYPTPWSRSMFAGELAKPSGICLGAFQGEDMLGYLIVARYVDAWHVMNVAVDPTWRGRGIARVLLERLFEITDDDPDRGYTLEVRVSNAVAIHLYESLGFVTTGVRRGYYTDNREDALIMWKDAEPAGVILGIETSCDETAAAVVSPEGVILSNVISSQAALHAPYGGVVPEVASRRHLELVVPAVERALDDAGMTLDDISTVAVTEGPGLIGALLVGLSAAKALAFARRLPLVPVNHLHGHVAALYLEPDPVEPPFLALLASGGHTLLASVEARGDMTVIGSSLDDAAGEAFDKGARLLGLGYPGGAALEQLASGGDPAAHAFPAAMVGRPGHDFSFSGLKTALARAVRDGGGAPADLAASYQAAIVRALVERAAEAVEATGAGTLAVVGGVARNSVLREAAARRCRELGVRLALAPPELCSDNAAMIASAARFITPLPFPDYLSRDAYATAA